MATINVKDAAGSTVALEKPLIPGQAAMAASRPVVIASDQSALPVASHAVTNAGTFAVQNSAATPAGSALIGKVDVQLAGTVPDTGSGTGGTKTQRIIVDSSQLGTLGPAAASASVPMTGQGQQAHDAADSNNFPMKIGAKAQSSEVAVVSSGDIANLTTDLVGKLIVLPYANPENFVSGAITSAMTGTTTTSLLAAPAAGLRNYITQITVSNAHATVGTDVIIQDGSGGTTLYTIPAAAVYGGAVITFPTPLRQPTTATAIFCANVTTGASTKVSASGYKGA